ncbi:MAG TPA: trimethylamine methyltransferase family protein [Anaerolineales bacterium]|nr:trimethylamine methyltransferase family protein [Anaerolineales bacterium]
MLTLVPVLSEGDVKRIHAHSLDVLENVGIDYKTPKALEILEEKGCRVDYDRNWVSIHPDLVEWAIQQSPRDVLLAARDPKHDVLLDGSRSHHTTDSQGTRAIDFDTGEIHDSSSEDLKKMLQIADALDKVEIVNVTVSASDIPAHLRTIYHFAQAFSLTSKHVRTGVLNTQQVPFLVELVKAVTGSDTFRPIFSAVDCTISPLMHDGPMTEACIELAKLNVPIMVYPMPLAGGTSPVTLGGTMLMHNIEFLSGLVLLQCVNPGAPVIYGTGSSQLDMRTGRYGGSADGFGTGAALINMAQHYDIPANMWGMSTKSKQLDAQYGYESFAGTMLAYLAGADEIYSHGLLGAAQILSLDKMVADNHIIHQIEAMLTPAKMDDAHLQVDLIKQVGVGGEFLTKRETLQYTRQEYIPMWPPHGIDLINLIHAEAQEIIQTHTPPPLPEGTEARIQEILEEADKALIT